MTFPAYFTNEDSNYLKHDGFDPWDRRRDALDTRSVLPAVYHPPCRQWGRLKGMSRPNLSEKLLGLWALDRVREFGGVLEHPRSSGLWDYVNDEARSRYDEHGGFLLSVNLNWFGFPAQKKTVLYIVGCFRSELPRIPLSFDAVTHKVGRSGDGLKDLPKRMRSETPVCMVEWIFDVLNVIHSRSGYDWVEYVGSRFREIGTSHFLPAHGQD